MTDQTTPQSAPAGANIYVQPAPIPQSNGLATASLVLGVIALAVVWIPIVGLIAWILAPLGLIFGLIAMRKPVGRGMAIAGTVCSAIGLLACIGWLALIGAAASNADIDVTTTTTSTSDIPT